MKAGKAHPAQPSMMKYAGTELNKARHELVMAAGGSNALEWESDRSRKGKAAREWLRTKANSIEGGTSEVQLNIIAKRILDCREPEPMPLYLTDDQAMLRDTARGFMAERRRDREAAAPLARQAAARTASATTCGSSSPRWASPAS